ncbi:polysaccharide lyase [Thermopolyspora sp. NPDC052614]|uniref:polysaccharide lyase n=1 Tax=Thermopolyspora sp. NPDC052614 TaxID=3155682 RepID=UPI003416BF0F
MIGPTAAAPARYAPASSGHATAGDGSARDFGRFGMIGRVVGSVLVVLGCVVLASCGYDLAAPEPPTVLPTTAPASPDPGPEGVPLERAAAAFFGPTLTVRDRGSFGLADRAYVLPSDDPRFREILRVLFPAGSASRKASREDGTPEGGAQLYLPFADGPADAVRLTYHVRFPDGFAFVKGGKLPGLFGGTRTSGGRIPDGSDGLSTRYMWRRAGAGEVYAYLPTSHDHGTSLGRGAWTYPTGRWIRLEQDVRLNTPGKADGSITVRLDGRQVFRADALTFRTTGDLRIDGVFFSTFFGGDDASWSSPSDQHIDFAGFETAPVGGS